MNARSTTFEFTCLGKRINDIVSAIFHSIIFNRSFGKFNYELESSYSIGTLGFEEVFCDFIDFTYIRVSSNEMIKNINHDIREFVDQLRLCAAENNAYASSPRRPSFIEENYDDIGLLSSEYTAATGTINLEFFMKSSRKWYFSDPLVWEVWSLKFNCLKDMANESLFNKIPIEDQLFDKMLSMVQIVNNYKSFFPQMPSQSDLGNVFDTSYPDAQPYNYKISYKIGGQTNETKRSEKNSPQQAIQKFLQNKLAL